LPYLEGVTISWENFSFWVLRWSRVWEIGTNLGFSLLGKGWIWMIDWLTVRLTSEYGWWELHISVETLRRIPFAGDHWIIPYFFAAVFMRLFLFILINLNLTLATRDFTSTYM
jgi:hypothetical protein